LFYVVQPQLDRRTAAQLARGDLVLFDRVRLGKEATQVFHEAAGSSGGQLDGLSGKSSLD
jgi:hypothetical protein